MHLWAGIRIHWHISEHDKWACVWAQKVLIFREICNCNAGQSCFDCVLCSVDSVGPSMQMAALITVPFQQRLRSTALAWGMTGGNTSVTQSWSTKQMARKKSHGPIWGLSISERENEQKRPAWAVRFSVVHVFNCV